MGLTRAGLVDGVVIDVAYFSRSFSSSLVEDIAIHFYTGAVSLDPSFWAAVYIQGPTTSIHARSPCEFVSP